MSAELSWSDSAAYPGTTRRCWVHAPPGHDPAVPAALALFLDGAGFADPDGPLRATTVLDDLVGRGRLEPTLGVFVDPGEAPDEDDRPGRRQRNLEYDAADDRLAGFLFGEVLPRVTERWALTEDPRRRAVCGFSSGGNGALTVAWHRPDGFGLVFAASPSFAQMPGGNPYPALLPRTSRRPMRVLLHVGRRDLGWDQPQANWVAETLRTTAALVEAGHETRLVLGEGGHDPHDAGVLLPEALRWLFAQESPASR